MTDRPKDTGVYAVLLAQLRQGQSELEQLPSSYRSQLIILALGVVMVLGVVTGVVPVFVPPYLLLPFVLVPGWRLFSSERERRAKLRAVVAQIRIVEERLRSQST